MPTFEGSGWQAGSGDGRRAKVTLNVKAVVEMTVACALSIRKGIRQVKKPTQTRRLARRYCRS